MLDIRSLEMFMPLRDMDQLEMHSSRAYNILCGFDSDSIHVNGLMKYFKVSLASNKYISMLMDIPVINVLDV